MQVGAGDVLRGQQQEEEEGQVGRCVTDELDEGLFDEASQSALWSQQIDLMGRQRIYYDYFIMCFYVSRYLSSCVRS